MTITVVFDPPLPSDSPATFNTKAFTTLGDLNDWSTEANALAADVTAKQSTASTAATTATTQAGIATTGAGTATTQAGIATAAAASINAIEATIHAATSKATPVDADEIPLADSAASWGLKKLTWANLKATLKTYFDTLYQAVGTYVTPTTLNNGTLPASVTTLTTSGNATLGDAEATDTHTVKGATTVLANSASPALKITQTGAGNAFVVEDSASTDSTPFVIDASGRTIMGYTTVITGSQLETHGATDAFKFSADSVGQSLRFFKGRGTAAAPWTTIVASGDSIASLDYYGADGAGPILAARITAAIDGTPGTNDMPGRLVFSTTADGAGSPTERMRIDSSGNVGIGVAPAGSFNLAFPIGTNWYVGKHAATPHSAGNATRLDFGISDGSAVTGLSVRNTHDGTYSSQETFISVAYGGLRATSDIFKVDRSGNATVIAPYGGLGYGAGAGGTVTQATSKSTGVTLNKPVGQITMNNAALGAAAFATFQFTNSLITATDSIVTNIKSPVSGLANYRIQAGDIGAGHCWISLQNVSAGSLSDAVVISFAVIKGATT